MKISVSPLTGTIYAGRTRKPKNGPEVWTTKEDVTDQVLRAAFNWLKLNCIEGGTGLYKVEYEGVPGAIIFDLNYQDKEGDVYENVDEYLHQNHFGHCRYLLQPKPALYDLYVKPECRGFGHSRELIQAAIDAIRATGYVGDIGIEVAPRDGCMSNDALANYYKTFGLVILGEDEGVTP